MPNLPERTFTSTAIRAGSVWLVACDQHPDIRTRARLLDLALHHQRHAIATTLDIAVASVSVDIRPRLPEPAGRHLRRARDLRATAAWANNTAAAERRAAALALSRADLTLRDIGTILGVSAQRAHQIIHTGSARDATQESSE